jgi:cobalt/nickel transport system ATP-binding protein
MGVNGNLIKLTGAVFAYNSGAPVLDGVDLSLARGEKIGLVGANGSGKTTLLHLIVGLLKPERGEIEFAGRPRRSEKDFWEVRARVGLLFQDAEDQLFSPTVAEDVAFGPLNLGRPVSEAKKIVSSTLERVGLAGFEDRITYRLSAGEKRLVSLATVLAMEPEALLLDEPTTALDEEARERIIGVLNSLPQAMIAVSHDRDFLTRTTDRALLLKGGRLTPYSLEPGL